MSDRKSVDEAKREAEAYTSGVLHDKEYTLFDYHDVFALVALAYLQGHQAALEWVKEEVL